MRYHRIFGAALACALAFSPAVMAAPLNIPPQQFAFDALGTEVVLPITADVDAVAEGEERVATGSAVGNLGDLQAKALAIAQALPLPKEQCANANGINVVVDAIHNASIKAEGNAARLSVAGTMTGYGCLVGAGAPIASTQFALSAPIAFDVASPSDVGIKLAGPVELVAAGLPADLTALLSDQVNAAIDKAFAESRLQGPMVVPNVPNLQIELANAEFFAEGETLMVRLEGTSRMSAETYDALLTELGATESSGI